MQPDRFVVHEFVNPNDMRMSPFEAAFFLMLS